MLRDDPTSATAVLKDVTDTVMRSKPWESFCTAVNDEVSKYLRKDNVEYFSDLSDDMRMFFMDKVEKELRESSEYSDMLDALGRTLDTKIASQVAQQASRDSNTQTKLALTMDKMADSVALLLRDLPSHKDSVRVLLNQELPPAIRAQVWLENLREPKARKAYDDLNARDGLATVAVEYPDITRRCQDVLGTSYVECQGRTVLTGALRTVMSYLHATRGTQELSLYRCLIPMAFVLGPTVDGPSKVVEATAAFLQRPRPRLPRAMDPHSRSAVERFAMNLCGHLRTLDVKVLHHLWMVYGGKVVYKRRDDARKAHAEQSARRADRVKRRAVRSERLAKQADVRVVKRRRRAARATRRAEAGVARQEMLAKHEAARGVRARDAAAVLARVQAAKAAPEPGDEKGEEVEEKTGVVKIKPKRTPTPNGADGAADDSKASDGTGAADSKEGDGAAAADAAADDGEGGDKGESKGDSGDKEGGDGDNADTKAAAGAAAAATDGSTSAPAPAFTPDMNMVEVEAELKAREETEEARFAAQLAALPSIESDTESDGNDTDVSDVSADTAQDVELAENDPGELVEDVDTMMRLARLMEDSVEHAFTDVLSLSALLYVWDQCVLAGFDIIIPRIAAVVLHLVHDHIVHCTTDDELERVMHLHCRNIRAQELRTVMETAFMPAIREDLGISLEDITTGLVAHPRPSLPSELMATPDVGCVDQQAQTDLAGVDAGVEDWLSPEDREALAQAVGADSGDAAAGAGVGAGAGAFAGLGSPSPRKPRVHVPQHLEADFGGASPASVTPNLRLDRDAAAAAVNRLNDGDDDAGAGGSRTPAVTRPSATPSRASNSTGPRAPSQADRSQAGSRASAGAASPTRRPDPTAAAVGSDGDTEASGESPSPPPTPGPPAQAPPAVARVRARTALDDEHVRVPVAPVRAAEPIEPGMVAVELAPGRVLELECPAIFPQYDRASDSAQRVMLANEAIMGKVPKAMVASLKAAIAKELTVQFPFLSGKPSDDIYMEPIPGTGSLVILPEPKPGDNVRGMVACALKRVGAYTPQVAREVETDVCKRFGLPPLPDPVVGARPAAGAGAGAGAGATGRGTPDFTMTGQSVMSITDDVDLSVIMVARVMDALRTLVLGTEEEAQQIARQQAAADAARQEVLAQAQKKVYNRTYNRAEVKALQGKDLKTYKKRFKKLNSAVIELQKGMKKNKS